MARDIGRENLTNIFAKTKFLKIYWKSAHFRVIFEFLRKIKNAFLRQATF
jgi:hypothetical protein